MKNLIILVFLALIVSGCQTTPIQQSAEILSKSNGYVYVNIVSPAYFKGIAVRSVATDKRYTLIKRPGKKITSYGLWLPAGQYSLSKWSGYELKNYPAFSIVTGRVTDLGGLLPVNIGGHELVVLPIRHPEFSSHIDQVTTKLSANLISTTPLSWSMATVPEPITLTSQSSGLGIIVDLINVYAHKAVKPSINKKLKSLKSIPKFLSLALSSTPPNITQSAKDKENNIYYGANLGQIRVRYHQGGWGSLNTGTLQTITAVTVSDSKIYAGSIDGKLRVSTDAGRSWQLLKDFHAQAITDIEKIPQGWMIITAQHDSYSDIFDTFSGIKSTRLWFSPGDFSSAKILKQTQTDKESYLPIQLRGVFANNIYYAHIYPDLVSVNVESLGVTTLKIPKDISYFSVNHDGSLLSIMKSQGIFSDLYISNDNGKKWKDMNTPPYQATRVHFDTMKQALATRWSAGAFTSSLQILKYDSSEDHWKLINEAPEGCVKLLWQNNKPSFCVMRGGSILGYKSDKWVVEYTNQ